MYIVICHGVLQKSSTFTPPGTDVYFAAKEEHTLSFGVVPGIVEEGYSIADALKAVSGPEYQDYRKELAKGWLEQLYLIDAPLLEETPRNLRLSPLDDYQVDALQSILGEEIGENVMLLKKGTKLCLAPDVCQQPKHTCGGLLQVLEGKENILIASCRVSEERENDENLPSTAPAALSRRLRELNEFVDDAAKKISEHPEEMRESLYGEQGDYHYGDFNVTKAVKGILAVSAKTEDWAVLNACDEFADKNGTDKCLKKFLSPYKEYKRLEVEMTSDEFVRKVIEGVEGVLYGDLIARYRFLAKLAGDPGLKSQNLWMIENVDVLFPDSGVLDEISALMDIFNENGMSERTLQFLRDGLGEEKATALMEVPRVTKALSWQLPFPDDRFPAWFLLESQHCWFMPLMSSVSPNCYSTWMRFHDWLEACRAFACDAEGNKTTAGWIKDVYDNLSGQIGTFSGGSLDQVLMTTYADVFPATQMQFSQFWENVEEAAAASDEYYRLTKVDYE